MRFAQVVYKDAVPSIIHATFFIQRMAPTLRQEVKAVLQDHIGTQVMTNQVQFDVMNRTSAIVT